MTCSSSLINEGAALVLDTSVLINLHASTFGERVLSVIPNDIFLSNVVIRELEHEVSKSNGGHHFLQKLITRGYAVALEMDDRALDTFGKLIAEHPSLGDGEAATVALATSRGFLPVIDDGKGRSRASLLMSSSSLIWSLDLFMHPRVMAELGKDQCIEAIFLALREGRMRIDEARCDSIVEMLGRERAMQCSSLPGYKVRRLKWQNSSN